MTPFFGRRYYEWLLTVNQRFADAVAADREGVVGQLRSPSIDLLDLSTQLGIVGESEGLTAYLGSIPEDVGATMVGPIADTVEGGGTVYFDWQFATAWGVETNALPPMGAQPAGLVVVLRGPFDDGAATAN